MTPTNRFHFLFCLSKLCFYESRYESSKLCALFLLPEVYWIKVRLRWVHYHISQRVIGLLKAGHSRGLSNCLRVGKTGAHSLFRWPFSPQVNFSNVCKGLPCFPPTTTYHQHGSVNTQQKITSLLEVKKIEIENGDGSSHCGWRGWVHDFHWGGWGLFPVWNIWIYC